MSCLKAFEIDLPGFLARPREDEFASFRDHYPRCSECSAEVRAWTELDERLRRPVGLAGGFDTESAAPAVAQHPPAAILAGYEADPGALGASERRGLERLSSRVGQDGFGKGFWVKCRHVGCRFTRTYKPDRQPKFAGDCQCDTAFGCSIQLR